MGPDRPNVLLVTLDQFRGDCLSSAGHPVVRTPHLDALAAEGVRFARHFSQAAPCAPGRASLYTGTYQFNHRVVGNGSPLDARFDNVALAARRAGYEPALFGYTDQAVDPRLADGPDDPRLADYDGVLPGFDPVLRIPNDQGPWVEFLAAQGVDVSAGAQWLLATESERPEELSLGHFLTDRLIEWIERHGRPWFAHLSQLRPHPPFSAPGEWARAYDPDEVGVPIEPAPEGERHRLHRALLEHPFAKAPDPAIMADQRAQYYGMIGHVDHQLGRARSALERLGMWASTVVIVTSDHGELLGDHGLVGKVGYWEESFHIPCIVRDPRRPEWGGRVVGAFTENVDVMPTMCELMGEPVPAQCDGRSLVGLIDGDGDAVGVWRDAAHWEYDWRDQLIAAGIDADADVLGRRSLERANLAVSRTDTHAYVQFGDGSWRCFDLATDPMWRTTTDDPAVVLPLAQEMLLWRSRHTDRTTSDLLILRGGIGRWPALPPSWHDRQA